jgi:large subunit ribosomal protein L35Ae
MRLEGYIVSFKRGMNRYYPRQVLVELKGISYRDAFRVIGRKVVWTHPMTGRKFVGRIVRMHGRRGRVIAYFDHHLPGQALGSKVLVA